MTKKDVTQLSYEITGLAIKVHKTLGPGLLESVYEKCLKYELAKNGYSVQQQLSVPVFYEGIIIETDLRLDLLVNECVIVELKAIDKILPLIDIAQIQLPYRSFNNLPRHKCQIWSYSVGNPSRSLSPYIFYRLMSWNAFVNDFKGIGFWDYADEGHEKQMNLISDPLPSPPTSYSAIYTGTGTEIITSRRWEAFSLGIEDYSLLELYAEKYGTFNAKAFALKVVNKPYDFNLADSIRDKIITDLSSK